MRTPVQDILDNGEWDDLDEHERSIVVMTKHFQEMDFGEEEPVFFLPNVISLRTATFALSEALASLNYRLDIIESTLAIFKVLIEDDEGSKHIVCLATRDGMPNTTSRNVVDLLAEIHASASPFQ